VEFEICLELSAGWATVIAVAHLEWEHSEACVARAELDGA